ncbi:hypothetical protein NC652_009092 [Populus alba x Populus x berolinensis]|nr:hypothetical protein NC652_009092 [Populus alba x Populus x berolinensis]
MAAVFSLGLIIVLGGFPLNRLNLDYFEDIITAVPVPRWANIKDCLKWEESSSGKYHTIKSGDTYLTRLGSARCGHGREDMLLLLRDCQWARSVWLGSDVFITLVKRICLFMCALAGLSGERMTAKENQSKKKENAWTTLSKILDKAFKDLIVACDMIFIF